MVAGGSKCIQVFRLKLWVVREGGCLSGTHLLVSRTNTLVQHNCDWFVRRRRNTSAT